MKTIESQKIVIQHDDIIPMDTAIIAKIIKLGLKEYMFALPTGYCKVDCVEVVGEHEGIYIYFDGMKKNDN
jgi:hypothetical protein